METGNRRQKLPDYPGSQQMEPLLQALRSESSSGRVLRKHIEKSSNVVCPVSSAQYKFSNNYVDIYWRIFRLHGVRGSVFVFLWLCMIALLLPIFSSWNMLQSWRNCLRFWECCQEYHKLFYLEILNKPQFERRAKVQLIIFCCNFAVICKQATKAEYELCCPARSCAAV